MKYFINAVYDKKAQAFLPPFCSATLGTAERMFTDGVNTDSSDNTMYRHPEDYTLFNIGTFEDTDSSIAWSAPSLIAEAVSVKL